MSKNKTEVDLSTLVEDPTKYEYVIGLDEVGWGAIAGPITMAAVVVPFEFENPGFKDSKRYRTDKSRFKGAEFAKENTVAHMVALAHACDVHKYGPAKALAYLQRTLTRKLMARFGPNILVVIDGNKACAGVPKAQQLAIVGGDATVPAISAASIIAKASRDGYMINQGNKNFPYWEFGKNKGYPTPEHMEKLREWGPTTLHRQNIAAVMQALEKRGWYNEDVHQVLSA